MWKKFGRFLETIDDPIDIILFPIYIILGKIYLTIRYRSKEKRAEVFQTDFDGSYGLLVKLKIAQLIAFVFALAILIGLIFLVINVIRGKM